MGLFTPSEKQLIKKYKASLQSRKNHARSLKLAAQLDPLASMGSYDGTVLEYTLFSTRLPHDEVKELFLVLNKKPIPANILGQHARRCIWHGRTDMAKTLITLGGDVNGLDGDGEGFLHAALQSKAEDLAHWLLDHCADASVKTNIGKSSIEDAVENGLSVELLRRLVDGGADVNAVWYDTTLNIAIKKDNDAAFSFLMSLSQLDVNLPGFNKMTAMHVLCGEKFDASSMAAMVERGGFDLTLRDYHGNTPLYYAGKYARVQAIQMLEAAVPAGSLDMDDALFGAATAGNTAMVSYLLSRGAAVNAADVTGKTALMLAAQTGAIDCVRLLLESGADRQVVCHDGRTAMSYAGENNDIRILLSTVNALPAGQKTVVAARADSGLRRTGDYTVECVDQSGLATTFNFWTQQVIIRDIARGGAPAIQNFDDVQRYEAVEEAYQKLVAQGGTPPDLKKAVRMFKKTIEV